jgi:hypothetical protein
MAADVWESKPFPAWTDKELEKVLTSSPWAGKASITYIRTRPQPIQEEAIVTWASAPVMRQALAREEFGARAEMPKDVTALVTRTPPFYVVTVRISKGPGASSHAARAAAMRDETFLQLRGQPPIPAVEAEGKVMGQDGKPVALAAPAGLPVVGASGRVGTALFAQRGGGGGVGAGGGGRAGQRGGGTGGQPTGQRGGNRGRGGFGGPASSTASLVIFRFPRDPITLADREVEFVTKLCGGGLPPGLPTSFPDVLQLDAAGGAQRGSSGVPPDLGDAGRGLQNAQMPACNYNVKKTFKLKDMVVKGELAL